MLDVHAPHKPLENTKEFLLHLFTITVGLLIATQIESCVEWRHHVHLAEEARASLHEEIQHNVADLKEAVPSLKIWRQEVDADLAAMERIQQHPNDKAAQNAGLAINAHGISLRNTAWGTAQSTGALAYMPYEEAQRYASIYGAQSQLLSLEQDPLEDVARLIGLVSKFDLRGNQKISAEQAGELSEQFGRLAAHLATASAFLQENIELNQAFLDGREPKGNFSEQVH